MQRTLLDREQAKECNRKADRCRDKHSAECRRQISVRRGQAFERDDSGAIRGAAKDNGAEHRDNDCTAQCAEKIESPGSGAKLVRLNGILHDNRAQRIHWPNAATQYK